MYYLSSWWWFLSWMIPMFLLFWFIFGWGSSRSRAYRTYARRGDDWDDEPRSRDNLRRAQNRGRGPRNYHRADSRIFEDVCDRLMLDDRVDASEIEVHVDKAAVILTGSVVSRAEKRVAESIVDDVPGVADVDNRLRIGTVAPSAGARAPQPQLPAEQT